MLIFLTGFMGCGKSTIGKRLARTLDYGFADTDRMIEQQEGKTIAELFAARGEDYFRECESRVIGEFGQADNMVIATGGGLPCFGDNQRRMQEKGFTVYINMPPELIFHRLSRGRHRRPATAGMNDRELMDYIRMNLAEREECYNRASMIIDCNGVSDEYIASHIGYYIQSLPEGL